MLVAAVLTLLVVGSATVSVQGWRKLSSLGSARSRPHGVRPALMALVAAVVALLAGLVLTFRSGLAGLAALEFYLGYVCVAYPLLVWIGYLWMRSGGPRAK